MKFDFLKIIKLPRLHLVKFLGVRSLCSLIVFLAMFLTGPRAHAVCTARANLGDTVVNFPGTIAVAPNAPANTVLATVRVPVNGASGSKIYAYCSNPGVVNDFVYWLTGNPGFGIKYNRIYNPTSVPGIGYQATLSGGGFSSTKSLDGSFYVTAGQNLYFSNQMYVTVTLVATREPIVPGPLTLNPDGTGDITGVPGRVGAFFGDSDTPGPSIFTVTVPSNATTITSTACSVATTSAGVTLNPVSPSALTGVGSTAGRANISLGLNCGASPSKVFITLTDSTDPTNVSNILSLQPGSTASGVALQILNPSGNPVQFGPDSSAAGNTNQWLVGPSTNGPMNIPLTVRYVQTASTVKPGTVNGVATFTMSYQ